MKSLEQKLLESIQAKAKPKKTRQQRETARVQGVADLVAKAATSSASSAEDLVGSGKLGSILLESLKRKGQVRDANLEEVKDPGPGLRGRTPKRQRPDRAKVIRTKTVIVDGQEVTCKVLSAGVQYYTGKSAPSGRPPGGTHRRDGDDPEVETTKRLHNYLERQAESAAEFEGKNPGAIRKNGISSEDFDDALDNLKTEAAKHGVDLEEIC